MRFHLHQLMSDEVCWGPFYDLISCFIFFGKLVACYDSSHWRSFFQEVTLITNYTKLKFLFYFKFSIHSFCLFDYIWGLFENVNLCSCMHLWIGALGAYACVSNVQCCLISIILMFVLCVFEVWKLLEVMCFDCKKKTTHSQWPIVMPRNTVQALSSHASPNDQKPYNNLRAPEKNSHSLFFLSLWQLCKQLFTVWIMGALCCSQRPSITVLSCLCGLVLWVCWLSQS